MDIITCLNLLGFTNNEAIIYQTLSTYSEMTGYECAKLTNISRSNVYIALAGLCEKGGAYVVDGSAQKYSPVPIQEFCTNKRREFDSVFNYLLENMPSRSVSSDAYITITGAKAIINKMKNMIDTCNERIYISAETALLSYVTADLKKIVERGLKVVLMAEDDIYLDGAIIYRIRRQTGQIRLIVDSRFVLTGDFAENRSCSCLFSASETLVTLFKEAMKNEIRLIELGELNL